MSWVQHLILLPIVLPLVCSAVLIPLHLSRQPLKLGISIGSILAQMAVAISLLVLVDTDTWPAGIGVYLAADWAAPFGIALLVDRLAATMLLLTAVIAAAALLFALMRWSRIGVHFHSLFQFLLMGINGACLTHDFFNLFVFFEVMLAASYGLLLHGYNVARIRAGMQYIAVNLVASLLFLIGLALVYGAGGTLNMADLAARVTTLWGQEALLLQVGVIVLALALLTKSAMWPLGFWLPTTYATASPPVAAMFVLMTKVGVYVVLRIWILVFADGAGEFARLGYEALFWGGMITIGFGATGMLASEVAGRLGGYAAMVSSGILLAVIGCGQVTLIGAGLFYLLASTLAIAAFMLLIELVERIRPPGSSLLAVTMEAFGIEDAPGEPVGVGIPASLAFLGLGFGACAMIIAGVPPLPGFIAKFMIFHALLEPARNGASVSPMAWALGAMILSSGIVAIIALLRVGMRALWARGVTTPPHLLISEAIPIMALLALCAGLTLAAGPVSAYLGRAADGLGQPAAYVKRVLGGGSPGVPGQAGAGWSRQ